jgi:hypothetical protein
MTTSDIIWEIVFLVAIIVFLYVVHLQRGINEMNETRWQRRMDMRATAWVETTRAEMESRHLLRHTELYPQ